MRTQIYAYIDKGGEGLTPNVKEALQTLERKEQAAAAQQQ
jgi:hypothetical protein